MFIKNDEWSWVPKDIPLGDVYIHIGPGEVLWDTFYPILLHYFWTSSRSNDTVLIILGHKDWCYTEYERGLINFYIVGLNNHLFILCFHWRVLRKKKVIFISFKITVIKLYYPYISWKVLRTVVSGSLYNGLKSGIQGVRTVGLINVRNEILNRLYIQEKLLTEFRNFVRTGGYD